MSEPITHLLQQVREHTSKALKPLVDAIDRESLYPENYLRELGALGGFAAQGSVAEGGSALGLAAQIQVLAAVGAECGSTAFMGWCQSAFALYLRQSRNAAVRQRYLHEVLHGKKLAGTGMSNTVKHLAGIERNFLQARPVPGGYVVQGALPWVSNLGKDHVFGSTAQLPDGRYVMFAVEVSAPGVTAKPCPEFCALEGTRTWAVRFDDVHIADEAVLAQPDEFAAYIERITSGFILLQMGIGAGIVEGCLKIIRDSNVVNAEVNRFLDHQPETLQARLDAALQKTVALAQSADAGRPDLLAMLRLREAAAQLALDAAQSAALHAGAKGYLMRHPAQRRVREAMFVAIVTPAIKHLRQEIARLQAASTAAPAPGVEAAALA